MKTFWSLLKTTYDSWSAHKAPKMGAALAYYTTLSLAPLVVIVAGLVGLVVEHDSARAQIVAQFSDVMGREGGAMVETILSHSAEKKAGLWTALVGFVFLLLGASGAFGELQDSLNEIWEVPPRDFQWGALIRTRLLSFSMVFALGFLVLVSLVASAGTAAIATYAKTWVPGFDALWE